MNENKNPWEFEIKINSSLISGTTKHNATICKAASLLIVRE